jgi:hypothetical protein
MPSNCILAISRFNNTPPKEYKKILRAGMEDNLLVEHFFLREM